MKNATFRQWRVFSEVARHLSFARAAATLHLTPPAVTQQVKELEGHVGLPLFTRQGRQVQLTTAGEYMLVYARRLIGTVQGDLHDIGKNLVSTMWRGANFAVVDLGTNVPPERYVAAAREHGAQIVGLSALLTTTMPAMRDTVKALREADLPGVKVLVGGAPITQVFADEIGADGYAADAGTAVDLARRFVGEAA